MNLYYICINNFDTENMSDKIDLNWTDEFIGRHVDQAIFDSEFEKFENEYLFGPKYTIDDNVSFYIETSINEKGIITEIESSKYRDHNTGHGRPITDDVAITKTDISKIRDFYNSVIIDNPEYQYKKLIIALESKINLNNGFIYKKSNSKGVYLNKKEHEFFVNKKAIINALRISHKYIDACTSEKFVNNNKDYFGEIYIPAFMAVVEHVDVSEFWNLDSLIRQAKNRELFATVEEGYEKLVTAVKNNDLVETNKLLDYAPVLKWDFVDKNIPLNIATANNNVEITKLLLENKACIAHGYNETNTHNRHYAIFDAIDNRNYEMQKLFAEIIFGREAKNDTDEALIMIPFIGGVYSKLYSCKDFKTIKTIYPSTVKQEKEFCVSNIEKPFTLDEIKYLVSLSEAKIKWDIKNLEIAFNKDKDLCLSMLNQGCEMDAVDYFVDMNDFDLFEKAISKQNPVRYSPLTHREKSIQICNKGNKWYRALEKYCDPFNFNTFCKSYLSDLFEKDNSRFYELAKNSGIYISSLLPVIKHMEELLKNGSSDDYKNYVIENNISIDSSSISEYKIFLSKLNEEDKNNLIKFIIEHSPYADYNIYYDYQHDVVKELSKSRDNVTNMVLEYGSDKFAKEVILKRFDFKPKHPGQVLARFKEVFAACVIFNKEEIALSIMEKAYDLIINIEYEKTISKWIIAFEMMRYLFIQYRNSKFSRIDETTKECSRKIIKNAICVFLKTKNIEMILNEKGKYCESFVGTKDGILREMTHLGIYDKEIETMLK